MIEATFPLLGTAVVMMIVLPAFALLAKVALVILERDDVAGPLHGLNARYIIITAASVLPLSWLLSAGLHQAETSGSMPACLFNHDNVWCFEPGFFALVLAASMFAACARVIRRPKAVHLSSSVMAQTLMVRVARVVRNHRALTPLLGRVFVTEDADFALGTHGLIRPRVLVDANFAAGLSDDMLASALAHELEHVHALDPLRYLLLEIALAVNPFGRFLLQPHLARWHGAREAHCDREAVLHGAAPLPLAEAILKAARPSTRETVALGARDTAVLKLRIGMLLAFAERAPAPCCHRGPKPSPFALVLVVIALVLPHQTGTAALDALHAGTEHAFTYLSPLSP